MRGNNILRRLPLFGVLTAALCCTALLANAQPNTSLSASPAASSASESIDFNQATEAQLDSLRGVGPATTRRILQAREERPFSDWADLIHRVRGIGKIAAVSFSQQGFVVNGARYPSPDSRAAEPTLQQ